MLQYENNKMLHFMIWNAYNYYLTSVGTQSSDIYAVALIFSFPTCLLWVFSNFLLWNINFHIMFRIFSIFIWYALFRGFRFRFVYYFASSSRDLTAKILKMQSSLITNLIEVFQIITILGKLFFTYKNNK